MLGSSNTGIPGNKTTEAHDVLLSEGPGDTIQRLKFSNYGDAQNDPKFIGACSWDGSCKVWELQTRSSGYGMSAKVEI